MLPKVNWLATGVLLLEGQLQKNNRDPSVVAVEVLLLVQLRHSVNQRQRPQFKLGPLFAADELLNRSALFHFIKQRVRGLSKSAALPSGPVTVDDLYGLDARLLQAAKPLGEQRNRLGDRRSSVLDVYLFHRKWLSGPSKQLQPHG